VIRATTGLGNPVSLTVTNTPAITALFGLVFPHPSRVCNQIVHAGALFVHV
jgi:hypothetical protein